MNAFHRVTSPYWFRERYVLTVFFVCVMMAGPVLGDTGCDRSPIKFAMPETESSCSVSATTEADFAALGNSPEADAMKALGTAFAPLNAITHQITLTSDVGKYGLFSLAIAKPGMHLSAPALREAMNAEASIALFGDPGTIIWRNKTAIEAYEVEFYRREYPVTSMGGGLRECMTFVRYLDGNPSNHTRHVAGYYCEIGADPLTTEIAASVVRFIEVEEKASD